MPYGHKTIKEYALPMTCFCDIPLSQIADHISFYGDYGIGMSKKWGLTKGLNPILYVNKGSSTYKSMVKILNVSLHTGSEDSIERQNAWNMIMLTKEYHGKI